MTVGRLFLLGIFLSCFAVQGLTGSEYIDILGGEDGNIHSGYITGNRYSMVAFLNPSHSPSRVKVESFSVIPRETPAGMRTVDEHAAKARMFFRPDFRIRTLGRRAFAMTGEKNWKQEKITNGVKYTRTFSRRDDKVIVSLTAVLPPERAEMFVEFNVKNLGDSPCSAQVILPFSFLRNELLPLELLVQREMARYINGNRTTILCNEHTVFNGKVKSYWWRRLIKDQTFFTNYHNRERIPFYHKLMVKPQMFSAIKLMGGNVFIWDLGKNSDVHELDVSWDKEAAVISPSWKNRVEPGKEIKVAFRVLFFKNMPRVDVIGKNWVFGFHTNSDLLTVHTASLAATGGTVLAAIVKDENNLVLVNQRSEMPSITPFVPGRIAMRAASPFRFSSVYPVNLLLNSLEDNKRMLEINENIVP